MSENKEQRYILWTPEHGFDLSFLTIKKVAAATNTSQFAVKDNVTNLLKVLPVRDRVLVLEHMLESKKRRRTGGG